MLYCLVACFLAAMTVRAARVSAHRIYRVPVAAFPIAANTSCGSHDPILARNQKPRNGTTTGRQQAIVFLFTFARASCFTTQAEAIVENCNVSRPLLGLYRIVRALRAYQVALIIAVSSPPTSM